MTKTCCNCNQDLDISLFYNDKYKKDGKKPRCKKCDILTVDMKKRLSYEKEYWGSRKIKKSIIRKKCYDKNKEKYSLVRKLRYNDVTFRAIRVRCDHNRRVNTKGQISKEKIKSLLLEKHCYYCMEVLTKIEIEHKLPISRGGLNIDKNVVASCPKCNRSKGMKTEKEYKIYKMKVEGVGY